ncbi:MAG: hypothetical protein P4L84_03810 [Isosphaeraceae bacterium]|nr:hypothetical protein [Isosphaeraceae bacterium]
MFEVHDMPRLVRLSLLTLCSMTLLSLGLAGCDGRPADGTQIEINEVERKQAIDKMRAVMESRKTAKAGLKSPGSKSH